jgi:hypothetical protein
MKSTARKKSFLVSRRLWQVLFLEMAQKKLLMMRRPAVVIASPTNAAYK